MTDYICENCGGNFFRDQTNRGIVWRCRNPACSVDEVDPPVVEIVEEAEDDE